MLSLQQYGSSDEDSSSSSEAEGEGNTQAKEPPNNKETQPSKGTLPDDESSQSGNTSPAETSLKGASTDNSPKDTAPDDTSPDVTSPDVTSSDDTSPDNTSRGDTSPENGSSRDSSSKDGSSKDASPKNPSPKDTSSKNTSPKDASSKNNSPKDTSSKNTSPKDSSPKHTSSKDTSLKNTSSKDTSSKDTSSKDTSPKDTSPKNTSPKNTSSKDTSSKDTSLKDTSPKDISPKDTSSKDKSSKDKSSKDTSSKDTSSKNKSSKDTSPKNTSFKNTSHKNTYSKNTHSKNTSSKNTPSKNTPSKNTSKDTSSNDSSPEYISPEEDSQEPGDPPENCDLHLKPLAQPEFSVKKSLQICAAPTVLPTGSEECIQHIDPLSKEITFNPKYEELFAPMVGPDNPFRTKQMKSERNMLSGYVEPAHMSEFQFENQRRTFNSFGFALDPSVGGNVVEGSKIIGSAELAEDAKGKTVFESTKLRPLDKRKRKRNKDASDIEGFLGPWGGYIDEQRVMKPSEEEAAELEELLSKRNKRGKPVEEKPIEEKTTLHIKDLLDYQGRSFLHAPQDVGVNLRSDTPPEKCFLPKAHIHTWTGHSKGIAAVRWFPRTAHLLLSASMDCRIKIWEVYNERRCIRTYYGHRQAVRDINFNNSGKQFLSAGYDRYIKLWDTETGQVVSRYTSRKVPYCVKFNPDKNKQHLFVAGTSDKKIICWDTRSGDVVQEYDRHLGAVNSITFVDDNRRFVTTSDDKSLRVWEWDIPVDMKYIADPTMHSMPAVTPAPNGKWLACQSMDNKIVIFSALNRFKMNRKKTFTGHMVAGYACSLDFSPDMSYLVSGDADGKCYIWDWKTTKLYKKWKAHENVCISALWHPHEPSKLVTAGWDGVIKYWD